MFSTVEMPEIIILHAPVISVCNNVSVSVHTFPTPSSGSR